MSNVDSVWLLCASLAVALGANICKKLFTNRCLNGFALTFISGLVSAVTLFCSGGFGSASAYTLLTGVLFGVITAVQGVTNAYALERGPMAYTSVIISFSTLVTALSGALFFNETLAFSHVVGILLTLLSFVLAVKSEKGESVKRGWLALCVAAFLATGGIGIMQKIHQGSQHKSEINAFLIIAFIISSLVCMPFTLVTRRKNAADLKARSGGGCHNDFSNQTKNSRYEILILGLITVACGVCVALNNKLNLYLSGVMDSAVFFPVVNGGGLVLSTLAATVLFKERLSRRQWLGVATGIISVILLCNPFGF